MNTKTTSGNCAASNPSQSQSPGVLDGMPLPGQPKSHLEIEYIPSPVEHLEPWRSKKEVVAYYGMCARTVERAVAEQIDGMPHRRFRGRILFQFSAIDRWLARTEKYRVSKRGGKRTRKTALEASGNHDREQVHTPSLLPGSPPAEGVASDSPLPRAVETQSLAAHWVALGQGEGQTCKLRRDSFSKDEGPTGNPLSAKTLAKNIQLSVPSYLTIHQSPPQMTNTASASNDTANLRRENRPAPEKHCPDNKHKFSKGLHSRTCYTCGLTQYKDPATETWS